MVEESEGGRPAASPAVLLYRPEDQTVELRRPSHLDHTEIKKFSPVILRAVKVPKYDTRKGKQVRVRITEYIERRLNVSINFSQFGHCSFIFSFL